jgi:biopolymer transport protein ExbD
MSYVKGSYHRKILAPGYHIQAKFDLHHLRERRHEKARKKSEPGLPLVALIDIFSMLVIFLLMNFSASGEIFFMSKQGMKIPEAKHTNPLENQPLVTITTKEVILVSPKHKVYVQRIPPTDEGYEPLRVKLREYKAFMKVDPAKGEKRKMNIQADQKTPIYEVKRVMTVLITEGWDGINFAVMRKEAKKE